MTDLVNLNKLIEEKDTENFKMIEKNYQSEVYDFKESLIDAYVLGYRAGAVNQKKLGDHRYTWSLEKEK